MMEVYCVNSPKPELNVIVIVDNEEEFRKWYPPTQYSTV